MDLVIAKTIIINMVIKLYFLVMRKSMQTQGINQSKQVDLPKSKNYRSNMGMQRILCLCRICL